MYTVVEIFYTFVVVPIMVADMNDASVFILGQAMALGLL